jgi:hypothetical protein
MLYSRTARGTVNRGTYHQGGSAPNWRRWVNRNALRHVSCRNWVCQGLICASKPPTSRHHSTSAVFFQPPPQITEKARLTRGLWALFGPNPAEKAHSVVFFQAEAEATGKNTSEAVPAETGSQGQRKTCTKLGQEPIVNER